LINAITVDMAIGGIDEAIIHLIAMAGRGGNQAAAGAGLIEISKRAGGGEPEGRAGNILMEDFL